MECGPYRDLDVIGRPVNGMSVLRLCKRLPKRALALWEKDSIALVANFTKHTDRSLLGT